MKRSRLLPVAILVAVLFVVSVLKVQTETTSAPAAASAVQSNDASVGGGYWAAWAEAASL